MKRFAAVLMAGALALGQARRPSASKPKPEAPAQNLVQQWMKTMTLREKIAQLIIVQSYGDSPAARTKEYKRLRHAVADLKVGGIIVNNRVQRGLVQNAEPHEMATFFNRMQRLAKIPLIMAGDFERGASMRVANTTKYPHAMAFGAAGNLKFTFEAGAATAREARALGVHWVFAPDADVNNNPDNPIINIRSYGEDPQLVAAQVKAFIEGAHSDPKNRVLATAKHFPGHGDTAIDSHMGLARIEATRERMDAVELVPFRAAIEAGVDAIMTAHMAVPALEKEELPATVSKAILIDLLRKEMHFRGIVVTDAMNMLGLSKLFPPGEAAVRAIEAGVDVLLIPPNPGAAIEAIVKAVAQGRIKRARIDESVVRVLSAKVRLGIAQNRYVNVEALSDKLDVATDRERAQQVADRAVALIKNEGGLLPLKKPAEACYLVLAENRNSQQGYRFVDELKARAPKVNVQRLDPAMKTPELDEAAESMTGCADIVIAAFVSAREYRGNLALPGGFEAMTNRIIELGKPVTLIALGSPYLIRSFPKAAAYFTTYSTAPTSETSAVKALFGDLEMTGKQVVSLK
jgi:beta-N-acetylhexosaminidase